MKSVHQKRLFCDSELVFNSLVEKGVITPDLPVFTRSFVLANNAAINNVYLDDRLSIRERQNFKAAISVTEKTLTNTIKANERSIIFIYSPRKSTINKIYIIFFRYSLDASTTKKFKFY